MKIELKEPFHHQSVILNSKQYNKFLICGRRSGKTECGAIHMVLNALKKKGEYWWVSTDYGQLRVIKRILLKVFGRKNYNGTDKQFKLPNGSIISLKSARTEDSLRGEGISGLVLDEAAHIKEDIFKECLAPALKDKNGWCFFASTPNGYSNWYYEFYEQIKDRVDDWFVFECPSWSNPLINKNELEKEKDLIGHQRWAQEYGGKFCANASSLFKPEWFENIFIERMPNIEQFKNSQIGIDFSLGASLDRDFQAIIFAGWDGNTIFVDGIIDRMSVDVMIDCTMTLFHKYKPRAIAIETNGFQVMFADQLKKQMNCPHVLNYVHQTINKEVRISRLAIWFAKKEIKVLNNSYGRILVNQAKDFPCKDVHDDGVDALELAIRGMIG